MYVSAWYGTKALIHLLSWHFVCVICKHKRSSGIKWLCWWRTHHETASITFHLIWFDSSTNVSSCFKFALTFVWFPNETHHGQTEFSKQSSQQKYQLFLQIAPLSHNSYILYIYFSCLGISMTDWLSSQLTLDQASRLYPAETLRPFVLWVTKSLSPAFLKNCTRFLVF